jgi:hypothetical protein
MEAANQPTTDARGLSERVLSEILQTPALKELLILMMKDIDPDAAAGLVRTVLWGEAGVSLSLFGALPDMVNWLLEFLLETGRQLNGIPAPLLREFLVKVGSAIDSERLGQFPGVYGDLVKSLLMEGDGDAKDAGAMAARAVNAALAGIDQLTSSLDKNREQVAGAVALSLDELDTVTLGKVLNRFLALGNSVRRARRVPFRSQLEAVLSQLEVREVFRAVGGALRSCAAAGWTVLSWALRAIARNG